MSRRLVVFLTQYGPVCVNVVGVGFTDATMHFGEESVKPSNGKEGLFCGAFPPANRVDADVWVELEDGRTSEHIDGIAPAWITEISPAGAQPGDTITIHGGNFGRQYPGGFGYMSMLEATKWSPNEIQGQLVINTTDEIEVWTSKVDDSEAYAAPNKTMFSNKVEYSVRPKLLSSCNVAPGVRCKVFGGGLAGGRTEYRVGSSDRGH